MMSQNRQQGMTLIEILIVLLVVSVGMTATAKFQGDLLRTGADTKARTEALAVLQNQLEQLRISHGAAANGSEDSISGSNAEYELGWLVTDPGLGNTREYSARVSWKDPADNRQQLTLSTLLYADPLLGGGAQDNVMIADAACELFCSSSGPGAPDVVVEVDLDGEDPVAGDNNLPGLDIDEDQLDELGKKESELSGNDWTDKVSGNGTLTGTGGDDKLLITGKFTGSATVNLLGGDDIMQINGALTGAATLNMGAGDDWLILESFNGNATLDGGPGTDTLCFTGWNTADYEAFRKKGQIKNFELLLFNDGGHQTLNGYSIDEDLIPLGCGVTGDPVVGYHYPVTAEIFFLTEADADRDDVADIYDSSTLVTPVVDEGAGALFVAFDAGIGHYQYYLSMLTAEERLVEVDGEWVTRFVKTLSFTVESPVQLPAGDTLYACAAWVGEEHDNLELTLQDEPCESGP